MMNNIFNQDFRDFINALNIADVEYMLVGGFSVVLHGYSRTTGDMDIWVNRTKENYKRIVTAFNKFGMPVFDMTESNFLLHPTWDVYTFGKPPSAIDLMVNVKGMNFQDCYNSHITKVIEGLSIKLINLPNLIEAKKHQAG